MHPKQSLNERHFGKWLHIRDAYLIDLSVKVRNMPKLTDLHVTTWVLKMKIPMCAEAFSQSVSSTIQLVSGSTSETYKNSC